MIVTGVPYAETRLTNMDDISGGTPYGTPTIAGAKRMPSETELAIARYEGKYVAELASILKKRRTSSHSL